MAGTSEPWAFWLEKPGQTVTATDANSAAKAAAQKYAQDQLPPGTEGTVSVTVWVCPVSQIRQFAADMQVQRKVTATIFQIP